MEVNIYMNYKIQVTYGTEGASTHEIENVTDIQSHDDTFTFYGEDDILFIAPKSAVVYIKKV